MPITFDCYCGKSFTVKDGFAGKRTTCPLCRAMLTVPVPPPPPPTETEDFELVDDDPHGAEADEAEIVFEVVEPAPARGKKTTETKSPPPAPPPEPAEKKPKKKKRRKPSGEYGGGLAAMYMQEARSQQERDEARTGGRGEKSEGLTMFGIHVTAGVLGGAGMLLTGLLAMLVILVFKDRLGLGDWRLFYGAIGGTVVGGITLFRALILGDED